MLTSSGHPTTNGQAEKFVKIFKKSFLANTNANPRCDIDRTIQQFLINYRNTTHCAKGESPPNISLGRSLEELVSTI